MAILNFISDDALENEVFLVLDIAIRAKLAADKNFEKNVIDPFASLFEIAGFGITHDKWIENEKARQYQKTLQNHVGNFHQKILGHVTGWHDLGIGSEVDLMCPEKKIIAEIKNKYSTVSGGKLKDVYQDLKSLVTPKSSQYKDYTAYFVTIIPRSPGRFDKAFTPSDRSTGGKCEENSLIRTIDGANFYSLVTGEDDALEALFNALPAVITKILQSRFKKSGLSPTDTKLIAQHFNAAFVGAH